MVEQNRSGGQERGGFVGARRLSKSQLAETDEVIRKAFERVKMKSDDEVVARHEHLEQDVDRVLSTLGERERKVTELRNGLLDGRN